MTANRAWTGADAQSARDEGACGGAATDTGREHAAPAGLHVRAGQRRTRTTTLRLHLNAHTKADRLRVAQHASSRGFLRHSDTEGRVRCPMCGEHVVAVRQIVEYKLETWGAALDGAMMSHLDDDCTVVTRPAHPELLAPDMVTIRAGWLPG